METRAGFRRGVSRRRSACADEAKDSGSGLSWFISLVTGSAIAKETSIVQTAKNLKRTASKIQLLPIGTGGRRYQIGFEAKNIICLYSPLRQPGRLLHGEPESHSPRVPSRHRRGLLGRRSGLPSTFLPSG